MEHISTTPFGRRPVTAGLLAAQIQAQKPPALPSVDKYSVLDDLRAARVQFGLSDRDLTVLYALISFHQPRQIAGDGDSIVYPSNRALADRAHGMAESTLRRHLAVLVNTGLILRHDSPNGKRYAARDAGGNVVRAFGFDLRPLVVLATQISAAATEARENALAHRRLREDVVLLLRDGCKLIAYGIDSLPAVDWDTLEQHATVLRKSLRRQLDTETLEGMKAEARTILSAVHELIDPDFEGIETIDMSGSDVQNEQHYQNSNKDLSDFEPCLENSKRGEGRDQTITSDPAVREAQKPPTPNIPLGLVLKACPDILPYARDDIQHWHQLVATASDVRGMMGISPQAWEDAQRTMGRETAAITCAAILQRVEDIRNPGGYLRALTARCATQGFSPGPMIMALLNG
jgi:replication initiation protein RepC